MERTVFSQSIFIDALIHDFSFESVTLMAFQLFFSFDALYHCITIKSTNLHHQWRNVMLLQKFKMKMLNILIVIENCCE